MTGFWSGAGAGLLGAIGTGLNLSFSGISSSRASKYAIRAMNHQDWLNRNFAKDQYSILRESLSKGGYNPLLAVGSSVNTPSSIGSGVGSDSDIGSEGIASAIDAMRLRNETKLNKSQLKVNDSVSDLNTQQTYKTFADELKARAEARAISANEAKIYNDINWDNLINNAQLKRIIAETKYTNERSRGFSASSSKSHQYGSNESTNLHLFGGYSEGNNQSYSESNSRSW